VVGAGRVGPSSQGPATYDLICLANIDWDARYQRPQQLASQFARHGHRVFYLIASRHLPADDSQGFRATEVERDIWEVELAAAQAPDRYGTVLDTNTLSSFLGSVSALRSAFEIVDAVVDVHLAFWTPLALRLRETWGWPVLYDCMDEWEDFPGIGRPLLQAEQELIGSSDVVTVTAALLEEKLRDKNPRCTLVRNGVDFAFFRERYQPSPILGDLEHPIIGFYGALAEWVDLGLLAEVARARPDWQLVLIGDVFVADLEGLDRLSNVHLLGRRPYDDMPRYLYHFDVCLIPFRLNQVTHAVDPVKFYEYISDGTPVVAVPLKELAIYEDYLYFAETPSAFVEGIEAALAENDPALRERRVALARANDWRDRYQRMDRAIVAATRRVSIIIVTYKNLELSQLCLESLLRNTTHPDYELIVVDNDSRDGTANYLRYMQERHERIKVIINDDNRGFAAANNQGLAIATGQDLVLLNNDTVTPRGWLAPLLKHLRYSGIGLVGPVTNFVGNEAKIEVPYNKVEEMEAFAREHMRAHAGQVFDIGVLAMFCVAMRREVYEQVGPLDETFGIGMFEDDDYSNRIKALGYRVVCAEDSFVHHFGQAAFKKLIETGEYHEIWAKNQAYYEQKWGKWKQHEHRS
jgi:GT2 family glycosyltransferase